MSNKIVTVPKARALWLMLATLVIAGIVFVGWGPCAPGDGLLLTEYDGDRDYKQIIELFNKEKYWLTGDPDSPVEETFTHLAPRRGPQYHGQLKVKVLRKEDDLVGFVSHYMEDADTGFILYLAIDRNYRGRRLADRLMRIAVNDLLSLGARRIKLITRPTNVSAQAVYNRIGFRELGRDAVYVYYEYLP